MNKVIKTALLTLLINIAAGALFFLPAYFSSGENGIAAFVLGFFVMGLALVVQLIIAIVFAAGSTKKDTGKGMLLAVGLVLLVGLAVCSGAAFMS